MAVVSHTENDVALLARLMRAEAEGDGELGMLMVGNTGVNRVIADCTDFTDIRNINDMVYQSPGGFEATQKGYFYQRAREADKRLARRVIQGERQHPASNSLWFFSRKVLVLINGLISGTVEDINHIAFTIQASPNVRKYSGKTAPSIKREWTLHVRSR